MEHKLSQPGRVYITIEVAGCIPLQQKMCWQMKGDTTDLEVLQSELALIRQFALEECNQHKLPFSQCKVTVVNTI